jgi:predicted short-subunit dehydrogenase-like oxidoreductase (DUF2520 family)
VIGAGRVGTAVAVLLDRAGYRVVAASGREESEGRVRRHLPSARFLPMTEAWRAVVDARVLLIGVPDDLIEATCAGLATREALRPEQVVVHFSGSVGLAALDSARRVGAAAISLHPLQTFPDVEGGVASLPGSAVAVTAWDEEGFATGDRLAEDVGGVPFRLADPDKPLYHAAAVFCSNYLVAVEAMAEHLFRLAGLDDPLPRFAPLARSALAATLSSGPGEALTGPAVRGDVGTIRRNLQALAERAPEAVEPYVALARMAAGLGLQAGRLKPESHEAVLEALLPWS